MPPDPLPPCESSEKPEWQKPRYYVDPYPMDAARQRFKQWRQHNKHQTVMQMLCQTLNALVELCVEQNEDDREALSLEQDRTMLAYHDSFPAFVGRELLTTTALNHPSGPLMWEGTDVRQAAMLALWYYKCHPLAQVYVVPGGGRQYVSLQREFWAEVRSLAEHAPDVLLEERSAPFGKVRIRRIQRHYNTFLRSARVTDIGNLVSEGEFPQVVSSFPKVPDKASVMFVCIGPWDNLFRALGSWQHNFVCTPRVYLDLG